MSAFLDAYSSHYFVHGHLPNSGPVEVRPLGGISLYRNNDMS